MKYFILVLITLSSTNLKLNAQPNYFEISKALEIFNGFLKKLIYIMLMTQNLVN